MQRRKREMCISCVDLSNLLLYRNLNTNLQSVDGAIHSTELSLEICRKDYICIKPHCDNSNRKLHVNFKICVYQKIRPIRMCFTFERQKRFLCRDKSNRHSCAFTIEGFYWEYKEAFNLSKKRKYGISKL